MHRKLIWAATITLLLTASGTQATPRVEITPFVGMRTASSFASGAYENLLAEDLDVAGGTMGGLSIVIPVGLQSSSGRLGKVELSVSYQNSDLRFEPDAIEDIPDTILARFEVKDGKLILGNLDVIYAHIGGIYQFGDYSGWRPYVNGGLGATIFSAPDADLESESKFSLSLGVGVARMFNERVGARMQFKSYFTSIPATESYWIDPWGGVWGIEDSNWLIQGEVSLGLIVAF